MLVSRVVAMWLVGLILLVDVVRGHVTSYLWYGVLDEVCHLATAVVCLDAARWRWRETSPQFLGRRSRSVACFAGPGPAKFLLGALSGAVLIDIDHVPLDLLSSDILTAGTPRPYTHSLATMLVLIAVAGLLRRRRGATAVAGLAVGVGLHLLRDVATGPVALWWPVSADGLQVGYGWYAAGMALVTIAGALRRDRRPVTAK
jgi:hypothetical protein